MADSFEEVEADEQEWPRPRSASPFQRVSEESKQWKYKDLDLIELHKQEGFIRIMQQEKSPRLFVQSVQFNRAVVQFWNEEVVKHDGEAVEADELPIVAVHNKDHVLPYDPKSDERRCTQCELEHRASLGKPVVKYMVHVERQVHPIELVDQPMRPQKHKKRRNQTKAYHKRIQKKWNKRVVGLTEKLPLKEKVVLALSAPAFRIVRDFHNREAQLKGLST